MKTNNKTSIVNKWKYLYNKLGINKFAQMVERVTGAYPDKTSYHSSFEQDKGMSEMELIEWSIKNNTKIY